MEIYPRNAQDTPGCNWLQEVEFSNLQSKNCQSNKKHHIKKIWEFCNGKMAIQKTDMAVINYVPVKEFLQSTVQFYFINPSVDCSVRD